MVSGSFKPLMPPESHLFSHPFIDPLSHLDSPSDSHRDRHPDSQTHLRLREFTLPARMYGRIRAVPVVTCALALASLVFGATLAHAQTPTQPLPPNVTNGYV